MPCSEIKKLNVFGQTALNVPAPPQNAWQWFLPYYHIVSKLCHRLEHGVTHLKCHTSHNKIGGSGVHTILPPSTRVC